MQSDKIDNSTIPPVGRFAPSPTGLLHLGNAWAFLLAWLGAKVSGGKILLRHEDIDTVRSRAEWMENIERDLLWLGLDWDEGPGKKGVHRPYIQSQCFPIYEKALNRLKGQGLIYPCYCTRKELRALAGAPHGAADGLSDAGAPYPGICRYLTKEERQKKEAEGRSSALRLRCPDGEAGRINFSDLVLGEQSLTLTECGGDFPVCRSDGVWSYQLAVVCDDIRMGITQIVRGEDILYSTPRQIQLYQIFNKRIPNFAHIPLLHDEEGERLAKRHNSLSLSHLRDIGIAPENIIGFLAYLAHFSESSKPLSAKELLANIQREHSVFPWHILPKEKICLSSSFELLCGT